LPSSPTVLKSPSSQPRFGLWNGFVFSISRISSAGPTIGKLLAEHGADVIHCRYPYQDHVLGFDIDT
jgi:crotonobetainyl-CoA:carnitine CoA-transferase CaiB-like acyl-CoA transferase